MPIANQAGFIHDQDGRHPAEFQPLDLLPVLIRHDVFGIGTSWEGNIFLGPVATKGTGDIRTNGDDFCVETAKKVIVLAQLCQMLAAVWSDKSA